LLRVPYGKRTESAGKLLAASTVPQSLRKTAERLAVSSRRPSPHRTPGLDEIHAIADLLLLVDRNSQPCDDTMETIGMILLAKAKAARDARRWLDEHPEKEPERAL